MQNFHGLPQPEKEKLEKHKDVEEDFEIKTLSKEEGLKILGSAEVHGSEFNGEVLTKKIIQDEGLSPAYKVNLENGVSCFFSSAYYTDGGRAAILSYVKKDEKIVTRSYYLSNSQGVWRYLPNYTTIEGKLNWYSKGYGEESITLPIVLQKALTVIKSKGAPKTVTRPSLVFAGTARRLDITSELGTYRHEVELTPEKLEGNFHDTYDVNYRVVKSKPENLTLGEKQSPDFSKLLTSWVEENDLYGRINMEVFASKDRTLKFIFCRDGKNRAWIGGVENNSEIKSTGLRNKWVNAGDLVTPAYEYSSQAGIYGNNDDASGHYVDVFKKYLSKAPIIKKYLLSRGITLPTETPRFIKLNVLEQKTNFKFNARTFGELFMLIENIPGGKLQGTKEVFTKEDLRKLVFEVTRGKKSLDHLTREHGFRSNVEYLMTHDDEVSGKTRRH